MEKERIVYFDFLRIFAALSIILLHVSGSQYKLDGIYHYVACFWDGISRWGVPIFVMISGALFLDPSKTITIKNIFNKYIFRIAVLFIVWSLFYTCLTCVSKNDVDFYFSIKRLVIGYYHLWFLYMIAALYLITPLLRPITEKKDKNLLLYLLIIWFVMFGIFPFISFIVPRTKNFIDLMIITKLHFSFPLEFLGYFILGYYLHNYINIKRNFLIVLALLSCSLITALGDMKYSMPGKASFFLDSFCPFVIITAISIFLLIKNKCLQIKQTNKVILKLSNLTLGFYLIHPFFIRIVEKLNLFGVINSMLSDNNFFTIPILFVVVSICSFLFVHILSKIPIIKKYCL